MSGQADKCNEFFGPLSEHSIQNTPKFPFPLHIKYNISLLPDETMKHIFYVLWTMHCDIPLCNKNQQNAHFLC